MKWQLLFLATAFAVLALVIVMCGTSDTFLNYYILRPGIFGRTSEAINFLALLGGRLIVINRSEPDFICNLNDIASLAPVMDKYHILLPEEKRTRFADPWGRDLRFEVFCNGDRKLVQITCGGPDEDLDTDEDNIVLTARLDPPRKERWSITFRKRLVGTGSVDPRIGYD